MSESYIIGNVDKVEYLDPIEFGDGNRLREILSNAISLRALALLTSKNENTNPVVGRWFGDRIAIVSDYSEAGKDLPAGWEEWWKKLRNGRSFEPSLYDYLRVCGTNVGPSAYLALVDDPLVSKHLPPTRVSMVTDARQRHNQLLVTGYYTRGRGQLLNPQDLAVFDID